MQLLNLALTIEPTFKKLSTQAKTWAQQRFIDLCDAFQSKGITQ